MARYYWFKKLVETPYTPPISLLYALREALTLIEEKSVKEYRESHRARASLLYRELPSSGYTPLVRNALYRSHTIAAFTIPERVDSKSIIGATRREDFIITSGMRGLKKHNYTHRSYIGGIEREDIARLIEVLSNKREKNT